MKKNHTPKTLFLQPDKRLILRAQAARVVRRDRLALIQHHRVLAYIDRLEFRA